MYCLRQLFNHRCEIKNFKSIILSRYFSKEGLDTSLNNDLNTFESQFCPILERKLQISNNYAKPREVWVENVDSIKEQKRGLVQLNPSIFGTIPRLDLIYYNIKWQSLYSRVILYSAKTRAEMKGSGRKPHPQKGTGRARLGSRRAPQVKGGGTCHGPRNPTSYYFRIPLYKKIHGLTSTLSAKLAQNDLHVVDNINIPTDDSQYMIDLMKERNWGSSVLIVDSDDIMPRNISIATDSIGYITLMPVYGLNVYGMLKHDTLVLTLSALDELENKLVSVLNACSTPEV
ncbi:mitochondrial 50S ribosomal protein L4, putative [Pediculus humanus corporis]|uniref:Large ribosomal subunit protein uL4m n=1 Tax=Pediculus humanus subsp. corporis TaxID=121224 RepID=E0VNU0_PEDHC|nr:mitochondrial 50S ribosomal protein L4, putative [Pediculus humanus corporis]EEB15046.1 mitochondrial 50S ribosomal protein L4, putative [Pediculus humanus corporis]